VQTLATGRHRPWIEAARLRRLVTDILNLPLKAIDSFTLRCAGVQWLDSALLLTAYLAECKLPLSGDHQHNNNAQNLMFHSRKPIEPFLFCGYMLAITERPVAQAE
jgi:hypothetical protein